MKEPTEHRVPRPMGTTEKGLTYNKDQSQQNKQRLEEHLITHYLTNNFTYCNKHYNIEQLGIMLNIQPNKILGHTIQYGHNIQESMDRLTSGEALRAVLALGIQSALEDRGRAIEQYSILRASQGDSYKAFISGEVNKALKLVMESGTNIGLIAKSLGGGTNINILNASSGPTTQEKYITVDEAVMHLKELGSTPLALDVMAQQRIFEVNDIGNTPEVCALKQEGVDTSKEALNLNRIVDLEVYDHQDRRANEEGFDLDEDGI